MIITNFFSPISHQENLNQPRSHEPTIRAQHETTKDRGFRPKLQQSRLKDVWPMLSHMQTDLDSDAMQSERHVRLFRNGRNQALRIPRDLELDADEAVIRRDGERLIIEPIKRRADLATLLAGWKPLDETLPDIDEGLPPLDDIQL